MKRQIDEIRDPEFLKALSHLMEESKEVYHLSEMERQSLEEAKKEASSGLTISNAEMKKRSNQWL